MSVEPEARQVGSLAVGSSRYGSDVIVVSLAGVLDHSNVATAEEMLWAAVLSDHGLVVIDLYELEALDRSGIALFVSLSEAQESKALRILPSPCPEVTRILEAKGIGSVIRTASDRGPLIA